MRTKEITLYRFNELSDTAKEKVVSHWRYNDEFLWNDDNKASLDCFCRLCNITVQDWEYGYRTHIDLPAVTVDHDDILEFTGLRLYKYVAGHVEPLLRRPKYIGHINHHTTHRRTKNTTAKRTGTKYSMYYSAVLWEYDLTGYCVDWSLIQPILDYLKAPLDSSTTLEDLFYDCLQSWVTACQKEYEYWQSEESIVEDIENNEHEFTEDGELA